MPFSTLTVERAASALSSLGVDIDRERIEIERREDRWLIRLPGHRMAWFAASVEGRKNLIKDRTVLRLIERRCSFCAPRVLVEDATLDFDLRSMVSGESNPDFLYRAVCSDATIAARIGESLGVILAELHTRILPADVQDLLPEKSSWPESRAWILERLPRVIDDRNLIAEASEVLARHDEVIIEAADRVVVHADLGMHAIAYDARSFRVNGVFDFEGAAHADRHLDFRYLRLGSNSNLLDAALAIYERSTGCVIDRGRVQLYQAACALSYLAFRVGHAPEESWCGRTLEEDLRWTRQAIASTTICC